MDIIIGVTDIGLYDAFRISIIPILTDIAKILFYCTFVYGIYYCMQMRYGEGINRMKWAIFGYTAFVLADKFIKLVDRVANNINF